MSDIVERFNPCNTEACKERCDNFGVCCEEICIDEIESLRQRVKELEDAFASAEERIIELREELAALKQSQGKPVAYLHKWKPHANTIGQSLHFVGVSPHGDDVEITPLCLCSTPTIPEGWQIVTTERMKELEEYEFMYKSVSK